MPVRFVGDLVYGGLADEPYLQYETFPHPTEDKNRVEITLATGPRGYSDYDVQSLKNLLIYELVVPMPPRGYTQQML